MATKTLSLRIDEELIAKIDELVGEGQSRNSVIKDLIEAGLDAKSGKKTDEEMMREMMREFVDEATKEVSDKVISEVKSANDELYRDQSQQLAAVILPAVLGKLLEEQKKAITEELEARMPALPEAPDPQPEIEASEPESDPESVPADMEDEYEDVEPDQRTIIQKIADWFLG